MDVVTSAPPTKGLEGSVISAAPAGVPYTAATPMGVPNTVSPSSSLSHHQQNLGTIRRHIERNVQESDASSHVKFVPSFYLHYWWVYRWRRQQGMQTLERVTVIETDDDEPCL